MIIAISITLFFIILRFTVTVFNFVSNPKLTRVNRQYNDLVSILIPVRNKEDSIIQLLESIRQQDYKNFEVIVYDDDSSDATYQVCSGFIKSHQHFNIIKGGKLPPAWEGKSYACDQLSKKAKGTYFLFADGGATFHKSLINSAVHRMKVYKLGLLSLFPNQVMLTAAEKTTVPLMHYMLLNLLPVRLVYLAKTPIVSTACGQFMLFDADIYKQNQWHSQVKDIANDAEIMKLIKSARYNGEVLLANGMVNCRMFKGYGDALRGFTKNALAAFNYSIPAMLIYVILLIGGPLIVIATLNFNMIFFMVGLIVLTRIMTSLSAGQNSLYNVLSHPIQMINLLIIIFLAIQKYLTKKVGRYSRVSRN